VDVRAAAQLRASELDGLLDLERGELVTPTGRYALGTRRVLVPLLVTLVSAGDAAVDAEALHREVWGVDRFDAVAQTRLKVAVSRARSVLGARAIETMRARSPGGVAITRYRLAPTLAFVVLARS
jgi:DNA-binding winged helix-turn-helix (wHTH) protein